MKKSMLVAASLCALLSIVSIGGCSSDSSLVTQVALSKHRVMFHRQITNLCFRIKDQPKWPISLLFLILP